MIVTPLVAALVLVAIVAMTTVVTDMCCCRLRFNVLVRMITVIGGVGGGCR